MDLVLIFMTSWHFRAHTNERATDKTIYLPMKQMSGSLFSFKVTNDSERTHYDLYLNCKQCPDDTTVCLLCSSDTHTYITYDNCTKTPTADWSARQRRKLRRTLIRLRWAYEKHMFNIHLEDIMHLHAFTIRKDLCKYGFGSYSWLESARVKLQRYF